MKISETPTRRLHVAQTYYLVFRRPYQRPPLPVYIMCKTLWKSDTCRIFECVLHEICQALFIRNIGPAIVCHYVDGTVILFLFIFILLRACFMSEVQLVPRTIVSRATIAAAVTVETRSNTRTVATITKTNTGKFYICSWT